MFSLKYMYNVLIGMVAYIPDTKDVGVLRSLNKKSRYFCIIIGNIN